MAKLLKLRRGTTTQHSGFTGAEGELTIDVDKECVVVHDGSTAGGFPIERLTGIDDNSNALAVTIDTSENVGIGTASPTTKLEVNGTVKATALQGDGSALTGVSSVSESLQTISSGGQTSFTFSYVAGRLMVFLNGVKLLNSTDFTATNGTSVVMSAGVQTTDKLEFVKF